MLKSVCCVVLNRWVVRDCQQRKKELTSWKILTTSIFGNSCLLLSGLVGMLDWCTEFRFVILFVVLIGSSLLTVTLGLRCWMQSIEADLFLPSERMLS